VRDIAYNLVWCTLLLRSLRGLLASCSLIISASSLCKQWRTLFKISQAMRSFYLWGTKYIKQKIFEQMNDCIKRIDTLKTPALQQMPSCDTAKLGWPGCNKPSTSSPNLLVLFGHCKDSSLMLNPILIVDFQHICVCQRKRLDCLSPWQLQYCIPSESHAIEIVSGSVHHSGMVLDQSFSVI
jgi:hypothetical protein